MTEVREPCAAILATKMPGDWLRPLAGSSPSFRAESFRALFTHILLPPSVTATAKGAEVTVTIRTGEPPAVVIPAMTRLNKIIHDAFPDLAEVPDAYVICKRSAV